MRTERTRIQGEPFTSAVSEFAGPATSRYVHVGPISPRAIHLNRRSLVCVLVGILTLGMAYNTRAEHWSASGTVSAPDATIYVDVDSVRVENGLVRLWDRWVYSRPQIGFDKRLYNEVLNHVAGNCQTMETALTYSETRFQGKVVNFATVARPDWRFSPVIPGSVAAGYMNVVCANFAALSALTGNDQSTGAPPQRALPSPPQPPIQVFGSGFVVNNAGWVLTNYHVVADAISVRVIGADAMQHGATIVASDQRNDLALLRTDTGLGSAAVFRRAPAVRVGEDAIAMGFPLPGLLASDVKVSTGSVSALAGIADDSSQLQISVPVQPGNSGGPLLDYSGLLIGVIVGKLDALAVAKATGDIPENINFAIKGEIADLFLRSHGVTPREADDGPRLPSAEVAARGRKFVVQIECARAPETK